MAEITVDCYIRHCTEAGVPRGDHEWRALKGVKLLKGEPINGTFTFQINGMTTVVNNNNAQRFIEEICQRAGHRIQLVYGANVVVVPIPNSDALAVGAQKDFKTYQLARRIAQIAGCEASDVLRWRRITGRAHKNEKDRDADAHRDALKVMRIVQKSIVLFDDVVTSGSQMYGSKLALEAEGMTVVGMIAGAEVVAKGQRSDTAGWRATTRHPFSMQDLMNRFEF